MVLAAAGRRIDSPGANPASFPLPRVALVRERVRGFLQTHPVTAIVSSAACGADLIVLDEAARLSIPRHVVLPFDRERFRATSVTDRPGDWGPLYDRLMDDISLQNNLTVPVAAADELAAYAQVNHTILDRAESLAGESRAAFAALLIWDGSSRGIDDLTNAFGDLARKRGIAVFEISTEA